MEASDRGPADMFEAQRRIEEALGRTAQARFLAEDAERRLPPTRAAVARFRDAEPRLRRAVETANARAQATLSERLRLAGAYVDILEEYLHVIEACCRDVRNCLGSGSDGALARALTARRALRTAFEGGVPGPDAALSRLGPAERWAARAYESALELVRLGLRVDRQARLAARVLKELLIELA